MNMFQMLLARQLEGAQVLMTNQPTNSPELMEEAMNLLNDAQQLAVQASQSVSASNE